MGLSTIGSIATHIVELFNNVPNGVSGNMVEIVDMSRQDVSNFTGQTIGSNSINPEFQPPIVNLAKADTIDLVNAQTGGGAELKLAELTISDTNDVMSADQYRKLAQIQMRNVGRGTSFARSLS